MAVNRQHPERRRYIRIEKHFIISYYELIDREKKHSISQIKNISLGGICFISCRPYARGTLLGIELKTPYLDDTIHVEGTVLESTEKVKKLIYEIHLRFDRIPPESKLILEKTVAYFKDKEESL